MLAYCWSFGNAASAIWVIESCGHFHSPECLPRYINLHYVCARLLSAELSSCTWNFWLMMFRLSVSPMMFRVILVETTGVFLQLCSCIPQSVSTHRMVSNIAFCLQCTSLYTYTLARLSAFLCMMLPHSTCEQAVHPSPWTHGHVSQYWHAFGCIPIAKTSWCVLRVLGSTKNRVR